MLFDHLKYRSELLPRNADHDHFARIIIVFIKSLQISDCHVFDILDRS